MSMEESIAIEDKGSFINIKLNNQEWKININDRIGIPGGFGEVFRGEDQNGAKVAIKRLKLTAVEAAHREMQIGDFLLNKNYKNIVPTLDLGQDADSDRYYLVMPVCEKSLQDVINERTLDPKEIIQILVQILQGLVEVASSS